MITTLGTSFPLSARPQVISWTRTVGKNPFRLLGSSETWGVVYNRGELAKASLTISLGEYT